MKVVITKTKELYVILLEVEFIEVFKLLNDSLHIVKTEPLNGNKKLDRMDIGSISI